MVLSLQKTGQLGAFLMAILIFGFPLQSFIPFLLRVNSNPINVTFRIIYFIISLILIFFQIKFSSKVFLGWAAFIFFWAVYAVRLIYDLEVKGLTYIDTEKSFVYSSAFGIILVPSIAIYYSAKYMNTKYVLKVIFTILILSNICLCYSILSFGHWNILEIIINRANVNVEINGEQKSIVNPITISYFGEILAIMSIHILNFKLLSNKSAFKWLLYVCIFLGIFNLVLGGSRGPMVSFAILFVIELYFSFKKNNFHIVHISKIFFLSVLLISALIYNFSNKVSFDDISILSRLAYSSEAKEYGVKEERDFLFESAWNQFLDSPIIGDSFLTKEPYSSYSHNLILDVLMATGVIGMIIFVLFGFFIIKILVQKISSYRDLEIWKLYTIIYFSILLICMTSGGLFVSSNFWIFSAFILGSLK